MLDIVLSIAPIFALIVLGHVLRRRGVPGDGFWDLNDRLAYWVLLPALLFNMTSRIELTSGLLGAYAIVILGGLFGALAFALLAARISGAPGPVASSILQGAARHNAFIALAVAERMFGGDGLALATLAVALLVPMTNLSVVPLVVVMVRREDGIFAAVLRDLIRNPMLLSIGAGAAVNLAGVGEIPVVHDVARILGGAALPVVLLCVGANLRVRAMAASVAPILMSSIGKMVVFPALIVVLAQAMGLSETETIVALLFGAAPTASSGYALAKQLGGDAPLMAAIVTIQTGLSFLTLPLTVSLARWFI